MIAIGLCVLYSIGGGLFGYVARSADEFAGFCMAAGSFLALAYTFRAGEHIRVTLVLQRFRGKARRNLEIVCLLVASFLAGYLAFYSCRMVYFSYVLKDVSQGLIATPLWIPQLGMAFGATVFAISIVERLVDVARGAPLVEDAADSRMDR